jgi:hypothetical protein
VSALANPQVGDLVNRHFVSTYVKVGTFNRIGDQKQGGNVATYFCRPDGGVVHLIAGPVHAQQFLVEARWAVNLHQRAAMEARPGRYAQVVADAHLERLERDHGLRRSLLKSWSSPPASEEVGGFAGTGPWSRARREVLDRHRLQLTPQGQVHLLLALFPQEKIGDVYRHVFESILNERVSSLPVGER